MSIGIDYNDPQYAQAADEMLLRRAYQDPCLQKVRAAP